MALQNITQLFSPSFLNDSALTKTLGEATADKGFVKFAKTIEDDQGSDE